MHKILKRAIDIVISFLMIVILLPLFLILALTISIESKGSPIFRQKRLGYKRNEFKIIKFRTMVVGAESKGTGVFTNANDQRITKAGTVLRKYSLDELPQIFNIFIGDMSFIGPRPPVTYFPYKADEYPDEFIKRFDMKPGITGQAQISGRTNLTWPERFVHDINYIDNYTILKDFRIIFITIKKVFKREDVFPTDTFIEKNHKLNN